jgi:stage V sporulation protein K
MAMDAATYLRWTVQAIVMVFAIALGLYLSPWLGSSSFVLALLCWIAVIIGLLYAAERMPWIDRFDSISNLLRSFAPPLSDEEKRDSTQRAKQREQSIWDELAIRNEEMQRARKAMQFLEPSPEDLTEPPPKKPEPAELRPHPSSTGARHDGKRLSPMEELDELTGLASVKQKIREYKNLILSYKAKGLDMHERLEPAFVLVGNPGTGKTTVARIMGRIFHEIGYLPTDHLEEASREELVGEYQGDTERNTLNALKNALGGTFFIDEVYNLAPPTIKGHTDIGTHIIETLLRFMDNNKGQLVIVVAGYEDKMDLFLNANSGLRSRFSNKIVFPDYTPDESKKIFLPMLAFHGLELTPEASAVLPDILDQASKLPQPGNARDLRKLATYVASHQAVRSADPKATDVTDKDLRDALDDLKQMKTLAQTD